MKYLVDADVLSEPTKPAPTPAIMAWLRRHDAELAVSPVVLGELQYGILLLSPGKKRERLLEWFAAGSERLNVLDFDAATAAHWAQLLARLRRKGRAMPIKDSLVAATALQHGLTVVTHNVADYRHAGVKLVHPLAG